MDPRRHEGPALLRLLLAILLTLTAADALAQTPISLYRNFVGNVDYAATGGSLRTSPNTIDACGVNPSSTATLAGIPPTATVLAAYLYWAGSGDAPDATVLLDGAPVAADRVFTDTFSTGGRDYDFFAGFADVSGRIGGNGDFTLSGLTIDDGAPFCAVQAVVAGWSLVVVFADDAEDLRAVNVFDGFELFRASSLTLTVDRFRIPPSPVNGKVTHVTFEGDPQNSGPMGGFSESLSFNGTTLDDRLVPPGSAPAIQQFDGTINTLGTMTSHGVDVDTYDVGALLTPGDTSASTTYSAGQDLVLLVAEVISFTTEPVVDLSLSKTHAGDFTVGGPGSFTLTVTNLGPEPEANAITVTDMLPPGLDFAGAAGAGWTCSASGPAVVCDHPGPIAVGAAAPALSIDVAVDAAAAPGVTNTATVGTASFDADPANDSASDSVVVAGPGTPAGGTKPLYLLDLGTADPNGFDTGPRPYLSRTPPATPQSSVTVNKNQGPRVWALTPVLQAPLAIDSGSIPVTLNLAKNGSSPVPALRALTVELASTGPGGGPIGAPVTRFFFAPRQSDPLTLAFDVPLAAPVTVPAGAALTLTLTNVTPGGGSQLLRVFPAAGGSRSRIDLPALTVIGVDTVAAYDAAYPGGAAQSAFAPGAPVSIRASVSDPFGAFDIASVTVDVLDAAGATVVSGQPLAPTAQTSGASADYEHLMTLPPTGAPGSWTYRITAVEGTEATVTDTLTGTFTVGATRLMLTKSVAASSDPVNGGASPKAIPRATMLYTLTVANVGALGADADTVEIVDRLPPETALYVDAGGGDPIVFVDGTPASGLAYDFASDVGFSSQPGGGAPYDYVPAPDADGFDAAVTGFRVAPSGSFAGAPSGPAPRFELRYRVRID